MKTQYFTSVVLEFYWYYFEIINERQINSLHQNQKLEVNHSLKIIMNKGFFAIIPLVIVVILLVMPFVAFAGKQIITVSSDSMSPTLVLGDTLVIEPIAIENIEEGDIIAFDTHDTGILAHRVSEIFEKDGEIGLDTKGDHNEEPDLWSIYDEDLIGIVIDVNPEIAIFSQLPAQIILSAIMIGTGIIFARQFVHKSNLEVEQLLCLKCGHKWHPRIIEGKIKYPETCANKRCRSPHWNEKPDS